MIRTLILMRHAKSALPIGVRDSERPLSARGRRTAPLVGEWIAVNCPAPDHVVVSPATRARQTWDLVAPELDLEHAEFEFQPQVYAASLWDLLDVTRANPDDDSTLMIVGHNPSLEDFTSELAGDGDPVAMDQLGTKFPTAAVAVLTSEASWSDWGSGCARLEALHVPRDSRPTP